MASVIPNLNSTLGAAFLGNLAAAIFYGLTTVQTFLFFRSSYRDSRLFKSLIFVLWVIDSLHLALVSHGIYFYLVSNFANPLAIVSATWSILSQVFLTCISDLVVRSVFAGRVYILSGRNKLLLTAILLVSAVVFASGVAFACRAFTIRVFLDFHVISWMLYCSLGTAVAADLLIAISLCVLLSRAQTGFKRTDSLINILMIYAVNTGLLTSLCATACFITYALWPNEFIFMGIYFALSKLYLNSLLATLNARESLRSHSHAISNIPPTALGSIPAGFYSSQDSYPMRRQSEAYSQPSMMVSIDRRIERQLDDNGFKHAYAL